MFEIYFRTVRKPLSVSNLSRLWECYSNSLKGIPHRKMKIVSSYTHPHVVSNLYEFLSSAEQKGRYLEECTDILLNIFLSVQQKKEIHTGLKQHEGEYMMTELSFFGGVSL
ncbi:MAG: hypothetical protein ACRDDA_07235 [Aeromonas sp.]